MGRKIRDLTGQNFGNLTVVERAPDYINPNGKRYTRWKCICSCGNEHISRTTDLTSGRSKSCGCIKSKRMKEISKNNRKVKDISGNTYANIFVKRKTDKSDSSRRSIYECECLLCGKKFNAVGNHVESGLIQSCGCLKAQNRVIQFENNIKPYQVEGTNVYLCIDGKLSKNNTSGVTGVMWNKAKQQWISEIMFKRKRFVLYQGNSKEIAVQRRKEAERNLHGDFLEWYINKYPEKAEKIINKMKENAVKI